jgi:hypothetical protein
MCTFLVYLECKWFLAGIFRGPKFGGQISVLAKASAMHCHALAPRWLGAIALFQNFLGKSHDDCCASHSVLILGFGQPVIFQTCVLSPEGKYSGLKRSNSVYFVYFQKI